MVNRNYFMWTYPHVPDFYLYHDDERESTYAEATFHSIDDKVYSGNGPQQYWQINFAEQVRPFIARAIYDACISRKECYDFVPCVLEDEDACELCETIDDFFLEEIPFQQVELPSDAK